MRKRLGSISSVCWHLFSAAMTLLGISGIPANLEQWSKWIAEWRQWIDAMAYDPEVQLWADRAVAVAEFINQPAMRVSLFVIGVAGLTWHMRRFWRLRFKISVLWRKMVGEKIWITEDQAIDKIAQSDWGRLKAPHVTETRDLLYSMKATFSRTDTIMGVPDKEKAEIKFNHFVKTTLRAFHENNPEAKLGRFRNEVQRLDRSAG